MSRPAIRIIEASSPLYLDSVQMMDAGSAPSQQLDRALQGVVADFYFNECHGDSGETFFRMSEAVLFTLKVPAHSGDYILMIVRHPEGMVNGRLVKWDREAECIIAGPAEVKLFALYEVRNGDLEKSNLKEQFRITAPELEIMDTLGREAIVVQRLQHNGTFNAMERLVLDLSDGRIDTLSFVQRPL